VEPTPTGRTEIRPFVRALRPVVSELRPASRDLARTAPDLTATFKVLNEFFNQLAFNPGGREGPDNPARHEGYLFWLAWLPHLSANIFSTADAHGPYRASLVAAGCQTTRTMVGDRPESEFILNLTPILTNPDICGEKK
jgi:hypothetical protein